MSPSSEVGSLYDEMQKNQPTPLPTGTYRAEVLRASLSNKKNGVSSVGKVIGGQLDGQVFFIPIMTLTDASASIFFQRMPGFGFGKEFFAEFHGTDPATITAACQKVVQQIPGVVVNLELEEGAYQGNPKNDFAAIPGVTYVGRKDAAGIVQEAGVVQPQPQAAPPAAPVQPPPPPAPAGPVPPTPTPDLAATPQQVEPTPPVQPPPAPPPVQPPAPAQPAVETPQPQPPAVAQPPAPAPAEQPQAPPTPGDVPF